MKITFMIDHLYTEVAGTENQLMKLVRNLGLTHEVELICLRRTGWLDEAAAALPCKVNVYHLESFKTKTFWVNLRTLVQHLRITQPDIVHTFFPIANSLGVLCARAAGAKCIISSRRDYGHWFTPGYLRLTKFANRFVSAVLCNSQQVKLLTERVEGVPSHSVFVIPNGVDIDALYRGSPDVALKQSLGIPANHTVVTIVANFREVKRHDTLIRAMQCVLVKHPNCTLLMLGADVPGLGLKDKLLALASELGLHDRVVVAHAKSNIENYLSITDIGVNSSENEGLSNAVIEYMCARAVSVVSDGGGNRDLVQDGINGFVFPVGDHEALANKLETLIASPELRSQLADTALQIIRREMSLPIVLNRFVNFYKTQIGIHSTENKPTPARPLKDLPYRVLSSRPVTSWGLSSGAKQGVTTFMYHEVGSNENDANAWQIVKESDFLAQLDFIREQYEVVSLDEANEFIRKPKKLNKPLATLTFDDGLKGNIQRLLPIVESLEMPITIYIATGHVEAQHSFWADKIVNALQNAHCVAIDLRPFGLGIFRIDKADPESRWAQTSSLLDALKTCPPTNQAKAVNSVLEQISPGLAPSVLAPLSVQEVQELAHSKFVTLGAHTHGHEVLTMLTDDEIVQTVEKSLSRLLQWTGCRPQHFAYPCGLHDARVRRVIEGLGFLTGMSGHSGIWLAESERFNIPRVSVGRWDSLSRFKAQAAVLTHPALDSIVRSRQPSTY